MTNSPVSRLPRWQHKPTRVMNDERRTRYLTVKVLNVTLCCSYVRRHHWGEEGKGYWDLSVPSLQIPIIPVIVSKYEALFFKAFLRLGSRPLLLSQIVLLKIIPLPIVIDQIYITVLLHNFHRNTISRRIKNIDKKWNHTNNRGIYRRLFIILGYR